MKKKIIKIKMILKQIQIQKPIQILILEQIQNPTMMMIQRIKLIKTL